MVATQQARKRGLARYGDDFWGNDIDRTPRRPAPPASTSSRLHWRSFFGSKHLGTRPANATPRQPRHWNFNLSPIGTSSRTVGVAAAREEDIRHYPTHRGRSGRSYGTYYCYNLRRGQRFYATRPSCSGISSTINTNTGLNWWNESSLLRS
ncbi:hypothetical protein BDR05DRAFT_577875 [Suillus weaverae]|nr:hypothetical protein BDR05DRAFT_577875 [Suillus weaverae]